MTGVFAGEGSVTAASAGGEATVSAGGKATELTDPVWSLILFTGDHERVL